MKLNKLKRLGQSLLMLSAIALVPVSTVIAQSTHTVQNGEWLWGIARQYGVTAYDIMAANGLTSEWIDVGTNLTIPAAGSGEGYYYDDTTTNTSTSGVHTVASGDILETIASTYGVTVDELMAWNGLTSTWLNVGDQLVLYGDANVPSYDYSYDYNYDYSYDYGTSYTIQPGDTLEGIAAVYGVSVSELMGMNGLGSDWLVAGNSLSVPTGPIDYQAPPASSNASAVDGAHTVQSGDILSSIALTYGVTVDELRAWNSLSTDWLNVGDIIYVVPTGGPVDTTPKEEESTTEETEKEDKNTINLSELPEAARPETHTVKAGDNVWRIAEQYNISAESLRNWNKLENDSLLIGQELFVSNPALIPDVHKVAEGENLYTIAMEYKTTEQLIVEWNKLESNEVVEGDVIVVSNPRPETHEVEPGQTLEQVAELYSITLEELRSWNGIPETVTIVNGTLIVANPSGAETTTEQSSESVEESAVESTTDESANSEEASE